MRLSWRELAKVLMGWYNHNDEAREKLDAIEHQHTSDDDRLKAVLQAFLLGEGLDGPSWRVLIHTLHKAKETSVAEKIKTNAEPQRGE